MTRAVLFDLDGTLVQTEVLKARSYAEAVAELTRQAVDPARVSQRFIDYVGRSRQEVVSGLALDFATELSLALGTGDHEALGAALSAKRLEIYERILGDEQLLAQHYCPFTLSLFREVRHDGYVTVLATMSHREQARRITTAMGIYEQFDWVLTRDEVSRGKPDPEIYLLAAERLGITAAECLVIEVSVSGIQAAQAAGMKVFALTNDITRRSVHECRLLPPEFIVDDLTTLHERVFNYLQDS